MSTERTKRVCKNTALSCALGEKYVDDVLCLTEHNEKTENRRSDHGGKFV